MRDSDSSSMTSVAVSTTTATTCTPQPTPHIHKSTIHHAKGMFSLLEVILLLYSCSISFLYSQSALCDCTQLSGRALATSTSISVSTSDSNSNLYSTKNSQQDWIQQHIIGTDNFPTSSVVFPPLFKHGFVQKKMCRGPNKTLCDSTIFPHSKEGDTRHGKQLVYSPYELGNQPISVDQICQVGIRPAINQQPACPPFCLTVCLSLCECVCMLSVASYC